MAGWLDALDDRSGPLGAAARAFCAAHAIEPTIRGLAAARALGRALDAFCHQVEGDDLDEDDRFVEQAGAYLGLVVLDAHGGNLCARAFVRDDGTLLLDHNCPPPKPREAVTMVTGMIGPRDLLSDSVLATLDQLSPRNSANRGG